MKGLRRNAVRLILSLGCAALALGLLPEAWRGTGQAFLPRLSPLLNLGGALAARRWVGWTLLLGIPLLVLPFFKGRYFCWRICPMGFLAETAGRFNPKGKGLIRRIPAMNKILTLVILVTAACGYPLLIWLDPLSIFTGFFALWREPLTWLSAGTGMGFVLILLLSVAVPNIWCHRLCPLGGLEEALMMLRQGIARKTAAIQATGNGSALTAVSVARRTFLAAIPAAVAAWMTKRVAGEKPFAVLRPPGAKKASFNALCARCGNCMKACPYGLIHPDLGESGIDGLFTPVLHFRSTNSQQEQFCFQDCTACTAVCPTGALQKLTVAQKHERPIGLAVIDRSLCIAWNKGEFCVVCDEYCPYQAIIVEKHKGVMCPNVNADKCRGCGACESQCPGLPIAITIHPIP